MDGNLKYVHVAWIPAIHAGMTGFEVLVYNAERSGEGTIEEINPEVMTDIQIWDKIRSVFCDEVGKKFTTGEIINLVVERYPDTNKTSIIPSDYCYNMVNKGIYFENHVFEYLDHGYYKVLGTSYNYLGPIFWKDKRVGEWKKDEKQPQFSEDVRKKR